MSSATALLASAVVFAQMQTPPGQQMPNQQPQTNPGVTPGPGVYPGTAPTGQDFGEKAFVTKAMEGHSAEVQLGHLAQLKSQSDDVKQLAQKLASDHTQMNEKWFRPVAQQLGVPEPKVPSKKDKKMAEKLEGLSASDFDAQYLTMMYKNHQKDLKQYQDEAKSAQDPNVKQIAEQGANVISQHIQLIEQVAKNHNVNLNETTSKQATSM
jgi:putative membrane protein